MSLACRRLAARWRAESVTCTSWRGAATDAAARDARLAYEREVHARRVQFLGEQRAAAAVAAAARTQRMETRARANAELRAARAAEAPRRDTSVEDAAARVERAEQASARLSRWRRRQGALSLARQQREAGLLARSGEWVSRDKLDERIALALANPHPLA